MEIQEIYTRALDWFDENLPEREQEQLRQLCSGAMAECRALLQRFFAARRKRSLPQ